MKLSLCLLSIVAAALPASAIWEDIDQGNGNSTFLRDLLTRNRVIAEERNRTDPGFYPSTIASPQAPSGVLIACSDSRLPDALIAGQSSGELFVVRNIANMVLPEETAARASVEYAVGSLGAYRVIVMGHDGCGGVQEAHSLAQIDIARHAGYEVEEPVYPLAVADWLTTIKDMMLPILLTSRSESPLVRKRSKTEREVFNVGRHVHHRAERRAEAAASNNGTLGPLTIKKPDYYDASLRLGVEENVKRQVNNLANDIFIQEQWSLGKNVSIHGWVYSLSTGLIRDLAVSRCLGGSCYNQGRLDGFGSLQG